MQDETGCTSACHAFERSSEKVRKEGMVIAAFAWGGASKRIRSRSPTQKPNGEMGC